MVPLNTHSPLKRKEPPCVVTTENHIFLQIFTFKITGSEFCMLVIGQKLRFDILSFKIKTEYVNHNRINLITRVFSPYIETYIKIGSLAYNKKNVSSLKKEA